MGISVDWIRASPIASQEKHGDARVRGQARLVVECPGKWSAVAEVDGSIGGRALERRETRKKEGMREHGERKKAF